MSGQGTYLKCFIVHILQRMKELLYVMAKLKWLVSLKFIQAHFAALGVAYLVTGLVSIIWYKNSSQLYIV